jgi:hypothetical protein
MKKNLPVHSKEQMIKKRFLPVPSKEQMKYVIRFLKRCARSKYSHDTEKLNSILVHINRFFYIRLKYYISNIDSIKIDLLTAMKTIAQHFCFVSDFADDALCTWDELVRRVFFVIPSIRIVNRDQLIFKYKNTVFKVHPSYFVYGYRLEDRLRTFNLTIY